ncbi:hypothetical protein Taro_007010 [Colocasia esculenta]|uniref:Uncharacterized protein n=1 Tax=Colocasia esculenta TaxID=4460 RepID=A0A843TQ80_COLES|nr:hypothetical protein [Colocasia esculenta]
MLRAHKFPAHNFLKQIHPLLGASRAMTVSVPRKHENGDVSERPVTSEDVEPIVVFSRPPPIPPVLGPVVLFSLLEMWLDDDGEDN